MKLVSDERYLLTCERLPALVHIEGAAVLLGLLVAQVALLTGKGFVPTCGRAPKANCSKFYSTKELLELSQDSRRLGRCIDYLYRHNAARNQRYAERIDNKAVA